MCYGNCGNQLRNGDCRLHKPSQLECIENQLPPVCFECPEEETCPEFSYDRKECPNGRSED